MGIAIFVQNEKEISAGFDREGRDVGLKRDFGRFRNQKQRKCHKKKKFFFNHSNYIWLTNKVFQNRTFFCANVL